MKRDNFFSHTWKGVKGLLKDLNPKERSYYPRSYFKEEVTTMWSESKDNEEMTSGPST